MAFYTSSRGWITVLHTVAHDHDEKQKSQRSKHSGGGQKPPSLSQSTLALICSQNRCSFFLLLYLIFISVCVCDLREWRKENERKRDWTICVHISPPSSHQGHCMPLLKLPLSWRLALVALGTIGIAGDESCLSHMRLNWPLTQGWLDQQYQIT